MTCLQGWVPNAFIDVPCRRHPFSFQLSQGDFTKGQSNRQRLKWWTQMAGQLFTPTQSTPCNALQTALVVCNRFHSWTLGQLRSCTQKYSWACGFASILCPLERDSGDAPRQAEKSWNNHSPLSMAPQHGAEVEVILRSAGFTNTAALKAFRAHNSVTGRMLARAPWPSWQKSPTLRLSGSYACSESSD